MIDESPNISTLACTARRMAAQRSRLVMTEDSWEHRMAARAAERRIEREAQAKREQDAAIVAVRRAVDEIGGRDGWEWLNGWPRLGNDGSAVLMGTAVHCIGCGRFLGITTVVFPEGWQPPGPDPIWPLSQDDCPICRSMHY
jgi:hypothetical protein